MKLSTEEIILGLKSGDEKLFREIFRKYYSTLCYEARGYIRKYFLVEEIVCDVFARIWINRENLVIKTSFREYLIQAVHNNCIDYYRHLKVQEKLKQQIDINQQKEYSLADIGENPLDYIIIQELEEKITEAIESLPEQYRKTFKLSRFNDLSYAEIAEEMGISINSVKTNIKNSLAILREKLSHFITIAAIIGTELILWYLV